MLECHLVLKKIHIKNSINIGKTPNSFASWVGALVPHDKINYYVIIKR